MYRSAIVCSLMRNKVTNMNTIKRDSKQLMETMRAKNVNTIK